MSEEKPDAKPAVSADTVPDVPRVESYPEPSSLVDVYRVREVIGQGGYGTVMLAHDELLDRPVALKFMHPALTVVEGRRQRFLQEARAMARIRHPNVVGIHNVGRWKGIEYLVMEYLPGPTLTEYLERRHHILTIDDALGLLDQICRGVAAIHEAGATHNDLKPSNMIIGPASRLGITDFGLAEWVREASIRRGGTVGFIAPEIIRDQNVEPELRTAADVYSLGVVAYILLTGHRPFDAETVEAVFDRQIAGDFAPPSTYQPDLGDAIDEPFSRALDPNPGARPRHVLDFLQACVGALGQRDDPNRSMARVLVIEDDVVLHPILEASLKAVLPNVETRCFASPAAALDAAELQTPDLVITDLNMPDIDGFGVVEALRARGVTRDVPIVAITGSATPEDWSRLTTLGADGFLTKPISVETLRAVVRRMLARFS